jgi:hypothetical protein
MKFCPSLALLILLLPTLASAQEAPERLLSEKTQVYLRWDGMEAHQAAFEKTALAKILQGDLGRFFSEAIKQAKEKVNAALSNEQILGGNPPDVIRKIQTDGAEAIKLLDILGKHGVILGIEVRALDPPAAQGTLIFPQAGKPDGPFLALVRIISNLAKVELKEQKIAGRGVFVVPAGPVQIAAWIEGADAVLTIGTDQPDATIKRIVAKGPGLAGQSLFQKVQGFKEFETATRGFIELASLVQLGRSRGKEVAALIDDLGLAGLRSLIFYSGFDGPAERSLIELHIPGPRKGLLKLTGTKAFKLADLPPMPPDVTDFSASNLDWTGLFDVGRTAVEGVLKIVAPDEAKQVSPIIEQGNQVLGINLRDDLLGSLDTLTMQYSSPSEGIFSLGQVTLIKVKDVKKLQTALDNLAKKLGSSPGVPVAVKKKPYHGVELRQIDIRSPGIFYAPTLGIHKDWLVFSLYPQPVHGFILRSNGTLPAWKPGDGLKKNLDKFPGEYVSVSVSDPRPTVRFLLSVLPTIVAGVNSASEFTGFTLDVSLLPNAQEVTQHLFPNVSIATDDGETLRLETLASLAFPF